MGRIVSVKCKKCGYEANLWIGGGMSYYSLDNVIDLFDKETQEKVKAAVNRYPGTYFDVRKEIGICKHCRKISDIAVLRMKTPEGEDIEIKAKCSCGKDTEIRDVEKILGGQETIFCPTCNELLNVDVTGHWD